MNQQIKTAGDAAMKHAVIVIAIIGTIGLCILAMTLGYNL